MILLLLGITAILLANFFHFLIYVGLGLITAAYIIPLLVKGKEKEKETCGLFCRNDPK